MRDAGELEAIASALLEPLFLVDKGIRLLGVTLSSLEAEGDGNVGEPLSLGLPSP